MFTPNPAIRIGIYGAEIPTKGRGVGLWPSGYHGSVAAAGATPLFLEANTGGDSWAEVLHGLQGVILCGHGTHTIGKMGDGESLCLWCQRHGFPLLAIDQGLLAMNTAFGGANFQDLAKECPEALQHRHPPEPGVRHAILVHPDTLMAQLFGEGEIVVNSEHRQGICRLAKEFRVGANALDGVIEAVESTDPGWFALGVQWQPASGTASGLDIQVFRSVIDAAEQSMVRPMRKSRKLAMAV